MEDQQIILKKINVHNLKGVDLTIPKGKLIVFTGVSGSGKSSLVFDTIYAEGQKRYLEALSHGTRKVLTDLPKPDVQSISGMAPCIAIEQNLSSHHIRSTVGTMTGIHDYLRVLFAKVGIPHCPISKEPVALQSREHILAKLCSLPEQSRLILLSPYIKEKKGAFREELSDLLHRGFFRARIDGEIVDLSSLQELNAHTHHTIDLVIDRLVRSPENDSRLKESALQALSLGDGFFSVLLLDSSEELFFSERAYSPRSGLSYGPLRPQDFSFNNPEGMCPECQGLGGGCASCKGARIKPYPAATTFNSKTLYELVQMPIDRLLLFFEEVRLSSLEQQIAEDLLKEILHRLNFLIQVGLSYLTLDRTAPSLSGGESQRVKLASHIGSGLIGAIYVLDEPSLGLHPQDHHKLLEMLFSLRDQGNTVLVVEHDLATIRTADHLVDVGPGAGPLGGEILAEGSVQEIMRSSESLTGKYLSGKLSLSPSKKRIPGSKKLEILGAMHHNLKNIDVSIPLSVFVCITGVSGSGKSSLIGDLLIPALQNALKGTDLPMGLHKDLKGAEHLDKVIAVDQSPIGRSPRSNAATYCKFFDEIRQLFADLSLSKTYGFTEAHFSFNAPEGACPSCNGLGSIRFDRDFLKEIWLTCPECKGRRYNSKILAIHLKGKTIADVLAMSVDEALAFFKTPSLHAKLSALQKVGLGYLTLGQSVTTLSGGEAQRIKLAKELARPSTQKTLYIFDEPTSGLHIHDLSLLISVFQELVNKGSTVLVIEHNMDLVKMADWVIDLGPGAGEEGGFLIGEGPPEQIAKNQTPTGTALKKEERKITTSQSTSKTRIATSDSLITVKGAKQHNLKNITTSFPRGTMTVVTGPSGSGKSSFAFDTLFAEGQRRFAETLPAYARSFLEEQPKSNVDEIKGLSPVLALEQKRGGSNRRSTVGTITEIYDLLRILYAHLGTAYCPETGEAIRKTTKENAVERILSLQKGEKIQILIPLEPPRDFSELCEKLDREGFVRIRLNGTFYPLDQKIPYDKKKENQLFLVIDRLVIDPSIRERLFTSIDQAQKRSHAFLIAREKKEDLFFNLSFSVEKTGKSYPDLTPNTFSFNSEEGMCPECQGMGITYGAHLEDLQSVQCLSVLALCKQLMSEKTSKRAFPIIEDLFLKFGINPNLPLISLSKEERDFVLHGAQEAQILIHQGLSLRWIGLNPLFEQIARSGKGELQQQIRDLLKEQICTSCKGERLNPLARNVVLSVKNPTKKGLEFLSYTLPQICAKPIGELASWIDPLVLPFELHPVLEEPLSQIKKRLKLLLDLDLHYLSLDRTAPTLSGGELQRIRLSAQLGTGLTSCLYILDEPTIGLHPKNSEQLLAALKKLQDLGNTLLLVEHDPQIIHKADYVIEFGPKAGKEGGFVVAQGSLKDLLHSPPSLTGAYLRGIKKIPIPEKRRSFSPDIRIERASIHNLKNISVSFPKGAITCLTGVSGSGKSTLMHEILKKAARQKAEPIEWLGATIYGLSQFEQVLAIDQSSLGQTTRSDVSTYSGVLPLLRKLFASTPSALVKGLTPSHFSTNHPDGMCRSCKGLGFRTVDLQFLPPVKICCEACKGYRLGPISLDIKYKGSHLGQVLEFTIAEALNFFSAIPRVSQKLKALVEVGLSYLPLRQEITSLSGGEAQRLRLSKELAKRESGKTLYLLDEPTVGLHSEDIAQLIPIFHRLVDKKNTLLMIEHNLDMIANADYVIDLGPEGGDAGGTVVATGTPEEIMNHPHSYTGQALLKHFQYSKR